MKMNKVKSATWTKMAVLIAPPKTTRALQIMLQCDSVVNMHNKHAKLCAICTLKSANNLLLCAQ